MVMVPVLLVVVAGAVPLCAVQDINNNADRSASKYVWVYSICVIYNIEPRTRRHIQAEFA